MAASQLDMKGLANAICEGILRGIAETTKKVNELDTEVRLVKGSLVTLIGVENDGSAGLIPRMEQDMRELKKDVNSVKSQVKDLTDNVEKMSKNVEKIMDSQVSQALSQAKQTSWKDGWKGVATFVLAAAALLSIIGGVIDAILWLNGHSSVTLHTQGW